MVLLNIYLITTGISWATTLLFTVAFYKKMKREGYSFKTEKLSVPERIAKWISNLVKMSIPVYNIVNSLFIILMTDKVMDIVKEKSIEEGHIYKENKINYEEPIKEEELNNGIDIEREEEKVNNLEETKDINKAYEAQSYIEYPNKCIITNVPYEDIEYTEDDETEKTSSEATLRRKL